MKYIASISYGKDSLAMLEIIKRNNMPLDRIVHVEIMATKIISADLPPMVEFKDRADKIIKQRYGIQVERIKSHKCYEEQFYTKFNRGKNIGNIYGFPMVLGAWCVRALKTNMLKQFDKPDIVQYIGIAADEPSRFSILNDLKISPLVEYGITENNCYNICKDLGLLSPIYDGRSRGGCWFCHNQRINDLRLLRKDYPEYWQLMMKWDNDSPVTFKPNGKTIHDFDKRFEVENRQISMFQGD